MLKANNHHYVDIIKDISSLFKNHAILSELFGLARESTAAKHTAGLQLGPGINQGALDKAESVVLWGNIDRFEMEPSDWWRAKINEMHRLLIG